MWKEVMFVVLLAKGGRTEFEDDLSTLTKIIVSEYYMRFKCVTYVSEGNDRMRYLDQKRQFFLVKMNFHEDFEKEILRQSYEEGCGGYIIRVLPQHRETIIKYLKKAKQSSIRSRYNRQRYLFLPTNANDTELGYLSAKILFYFPHLLVMVPKNESAYSLVTHTVFDGYRKRFLGEDELELDEWTPEEGFLRKVDLFEDKTLNVKGKNLRFALINYVPYSLILTNGEKTTYDGLEVRIARQFVNLINGTWDAIDHPVELWGDFSENGTASGILGSVQSHHSDMGFAAIYQWFCEDLDCSYTYLQAGVTCLVPRPDLISGWYTILIPFQLLTWIIFAVAYVLISLFVLFLTRATNIIRGTKNSELGMMAFEAFFNVFRLQLEQIPKIAQKTSPVSTYLRISTIYYYFVAAFWQGIIASVLLVPQYEEKINTAYDLVSRYPKVQWGDHQNSWILQISNAEDPTLRMIIDKYVIQPGEVLEKRPLKRDFGFFMERLPHGHYGFNDYLNERNLKYLRIMEQDVYKANVVTVLPRDSPYTEHYDHLLRWMFDTGLIQKLEDQVSLEAVDNKLQLMIRTSNDKESNEGVVLALHHLQGPLYIYAFGMSVSTVAFLAEIYRTRKKKSHRSRVRVLAIQNHQILRK